MSDTTDIESLPLSQSVRSAIRHLGSQERINSWAIVSEILKLHPEYARHLGEKLHGVTVQPKGELKTLREWLGGLSSFFDLDKVRLHVDVINGRLAIWGLSRLDSELKSYLDSYEFLMALEQEYLEEKKIHPSDLLRGLQNVEKILPLRKEQPLRALVVEDDQSWQTIFQELLAENGLEVDLARNLDEAVFQINFRQHRVAVVDLSLAPSDHNNVDGLRVLDAIRRLDPNCRNILITGFATVEIAVTALNDYGAFTFLRKEAFHRGQFKDIVHRALVDPLTSPSNSPNSKNISTTFVSDDATTRFYRPRVAGYTSDKSDQESQDLLDIEREVANIANVITFKQVQPPLALGLFGDWGSGKTFFMRKLRKYVEQISSFYLQGEQVTETEAMWCSRVAQIEFNAWHFSDSNLWASLVTRIYEGLDRELNKEKDAAEEIKKKIIEAQIKEIKEKSIKAESQLDLAKTRVNSAEENLKQKSKEREQKENTLLGMISSIPDLLKGTRFDQPLQEAAISLGMPEAAETYEALEELNGELKSVSGRLMAVTVSVLHSPWTLLGMTLFIVILPVVFTLAIESWGLFLTEAGKRVAEVSTFLLLIVSWIRAQVRRGLGLVAVVQSALQEARKIRQTKIENDEGVMEARKALTEAQVEEQAARINLEIAQTELQRLQLELQELRPERKLQRLIETRASTGAYAQHLGIISLIRSDFENMSRILAEMVDEKRDFKQSPPIQRIILYIDDLDRCKPDRVVEVLEAIHLLLFFQLFVVVVAVDPRWLRHSLMQHYSATLTEKGGVAPLDGPAGFSLYSTPQDYLEKIFQIPFALRPVEKTGYQSLVDDLLKPLPNRERPKEAKPQSTPPNTSANENETIEGGQPAAEIAQASNIGSDGDRRASSEETKQQNEQKETSFDTSFTPIPPQQLEFTEWEKEDIQRLWLMFRTPRTVKRFINIYRLLRAGLTSDKDVKSFEGTKRKPGEYQVALLLLAAITAFPNEANQLLYRLDGWLDVQELKKNKRTTNWRELIDFLKKQPEIWTQKALDNTNEREQKLRKNGKQGGQSNNKDSTSIEQTAHEDAEGSWSLMLECLNQVTQNNALKKRFKLATLRFWVMRVARFSFSVQPQ